MRNRDAKRRRSKEGIKRKWAFGFFYEPIFLCLLVSGLFAGCVRVAGTAGYWHTNAEGESQAKRVGFDTASLVPEKQDHGNVTV